MERLERIGARRSGWLFAFSLSMFANLCLLAVVLIALLAPASNASTIEKKAMWGVDSHDREVDLYTLTNDKGMSADIITYGATVTRLKVPDKNGKLGDVVLGFDALKKYENESPYFGATIGRVANRIAEGIFKLEDIRYCVPINNGPNHLHGGFRGYDKRVWDADAAMTADGPSIRLQLVDPDGTEGYPGTMNVTVIYTITGDNVLKIQYYARSDKATPINLTNHTYFNLEDAGASSIGDHVLQIFASHYTPVNSKLIPTGEIADVKGTPLDFTSPKPIGRDLNAVGGDPIGFDHNFCLDHPADVLSKAAQVYEPVTGRTMEVWTTQHGIQLYSGNFLDGTVTGKNGTTYAQHSAFCLETQDYPDAINHPNFPSSVLHPGEAYREITEYRFSASPRQPW
jgi:aldose 1-epimerase